MLFNIQIGLSDHTLGLGVSLGAIALGATVIEKHFTLDRSEGGVDSAFSLEPAELKALVSESERTWQALGKIQYGPTEKEKKSIIFRRSVYIVENIKKGGSY
jgi:sialic acid synthase SpsE